MDTNLLKAAYETYRAQIMLNGVDRDGNLRIDASYYYAVAERICPHFHSHWCQEPDPFEEVYAIKRELIDEVLTFLDGIWTEKGAVPTFYQLEAKFGKGLRLELIQILRYSYLNRRFDSGFYSALLAPTMHPTEASGICRDLDSHDFLLV